MNKSKFRIYSKIGLLFVIIGFFMPISCNLNGFQMAKVLGTFGPNLLSVSLYIIFLFSCLGMILLILIILKKPVEIKYDWIDLIVIETSFVLFVSMHIRDQRSSLFGFILNLQFGAYVILCGLVISTIYIIKASKKEINNFIGKYEFDESKMENNNVISTQHKSFSKVFCTQCGTELQKGNKFCTNCGAKI